MCCLQQLPNTLILFLFLLKIHNFYFRANFYFMFIEYHFPFLFELITYEVCLTKLLEFYKYHQ
jgi:hypothetical protein